MPASGTLGTSNAVAAIATNSMGSVGVNLVGNGFLGTLVFEATTDLVNWLQVAAHPMLASGVLSGPITGVQGSAGGPSVNGQYVVPVYGFSAVRVRVASVTNGTVLVLLDGATSAPTGVVFANIEGQKTSYSAAAAFSPLATDAAILNPGTNTAGVMRVVRVTRVELAVVATGGAVATDVQLIYRSSPNSGLSNSMTPVPHDPNDQPAAARAQYFTGTPTPGTTVGIIRAQKANIPSGQVNFVWDFSTRQARAIVLRTTQQGLALNFGNNTNIGSVALTFEWTEE